MQYYVIIFDWLTTKVHKFGTDVMGRMMVFVAAIALMLVTVWILLTGYRVITGQLREPLLGVVTNMARIAVIVSIATTMAIGGSDLQNALGTELPKDINQLINGSDSSPSKQIDQALLKMQVALAAIEAVQIPPGDIEGAQAKEHTALIAGLGTASPAMTAGAMLLMYQLAIALFIGLGPLFILCLIFEQTKGLFQRWLLYGIGTMFSLAMLAFVSSLALDITVRVAGALFATNMISSFTGLSTPGLSTQALQQGGLGLLMTALIITAPPMAAQFFQGTLGQFYFNSGFGAGGGVGIGADGRPGTPGAYAPAQSQNIGSGQGNNNGGGDSFRSSSSTSRLTTGQTAIASADVIKPAPPSTGG